MSTNAGHLSVLVDKRVRRFMALLVLSSASLGMGLFLPKTNPLVVVGVLAGLIGVWIALKHPYQGLLLYLVIEYIRLGEIVPALDPIRPARVVAILTITGWLASRLRGRGNRLEWSSVTWAIAAMVAVMFVSSITSVWSTRAVEVAIDHTKVFLVFLLITNLAATPERIRQLVWVFALLGLGLACNAVLSYVRTGLPAAGPGTGFIGDGNDFALALLFIFPLAVTLFRFAKRKIHRMLAGVTSFSLVVGIMCTFSRGGFLGTVFSMVGLASIASRRWTAFGLLMLMAVMGWFAAPRSYHDRIASIATYKQDPSVQGRKFAWMAARAMFIDRPFFGVGGGGFETAYGKLYRPPGAGAKWIAAHSIYYQCLGELGLAGCVCFGLVVVLTYRETLRLRPWRSADKSTQWERAMAGGVAVSLSAYLLSGTFLSALFYPHLYYLAAIAVNLTNVSGVRRQESGAGEGTPPQGSFGAVAREASCPSPDS